MISQKVTDKTRHSNVSRVFIHQFIYNLLLVCVQSAKTAPVTQLSVHNGLLIALTVHLFRDAVEKRVICAEQLTLVRYSFSSLQTTVEFTFYLNLNCIEKYRKDYHIFLLGEQQPPFHLVKKNWKNINRTTIESIGIGHDDHKTFSVDFIG